MAPYTCWMPICASWLANYVHDVYRIQSVFNAYKTEFALVASEAYWLEYHGLPIRPNPEHRRATEGRPVSTRIHNNMDEVEPSHQNDVVFAGKKDTPDKDA